MSTKNNYLYFVAGISALATAAFLIMKKNRTYPAMPSSSSSSNGSNPAPTPYQGGPGTYPNHNYTVRGYRNNNPLNIDYSARNNWQGQIVPTGDSRFAQFIEMKYGYRAAFRNIYTYINSYGANTIRKIITKWAPSTENATNDYISNVERWSGVNADAVLTYKDARLKNIVAAMSQVENGRSVPVPQADLESGWNLYLQSV